MKSYEEFLIDEAEIHDAGNESVKADAFRAIAGEVKRLQKLEAMSLEFDAASDDADFQEPHPIFLLANERDLLVEKVKRLQKDALKFYKADGSFELLDTAEQVTERRKLAAAELERLGAVEIENQRLRKGWREFAEVIGVRESKAFKNVVIGKAKSLQAEREALLLQAQIWAGEARAQQSITNELSSLLQVPTWGPLVKTITEKLVKLEKLPEEVACRLFKQQSFNVPPRRLVQEGLIDFDGPGWCKAAVVTQVQEAISSARESAIEAKESGDE